MRDILGAFEVGRMGSPFGTVWPEERWASYDMYMVKSDGDALYLHGASKRKHEFEKQAREAAARQGDPNAKLACRVASGELSYDQANSMRVMPMPCRVESTIITSAGGSVTSGAGAACFDGGGGAGGACYPHPPPHHHTHTHTHTTPSHTNKLTRLLDCRSAGPTHATTSPHTTVCLDQYPHRQSLALVLSRHPSAPAKHNVSTHPCTACRSLPS